MHIDMKGGKNLSKKSILTHNDFIITVFCHRGLHQYHPNIQM